VRELESSRPNSKAKSMTHMKLFVILKKLSRWLPGCFDHSRMVDIIESNVCMITLAGTKKI
jgi:hypothetical protein